MDTDNLPIFAEGYHHQIFDAGRFLIKKYRSKQVLQKEVNIIRNLDENTTLPIPKIHEADSNSLLVKMTKLKGTPAKKAIKQNPTIEKTILKAVCKARKQMANTTFSQFGILNQDMEIEQGFNTATQFYTHLFKKYLQAKHLSPTLKKQAKKFWDKNKNVYEIEQGPVLRHGDSNLDNYLIQDKKLVGIVDFEHAQSATTLNDWFMTKRDEYDNDVIIKTMTGNNLNKDYNKIIQLYKLLQHTKYLYNLPYLKWRNLNEEKTKERKKQLKQTAKNTIQKITQQK